MTLAELRNAMQRYATRFDAAVITAREAARVIEDAAAIEKMAATVKALAAARVAETKLWRRDGDLTAAHQLARKTGTSVSQAQETIATAKRLDALPAVTAAAKRGELSPQQTVAIADAATADPGAETKLVDHARRSSLSELREACARTKANATDLEARRRRIHAHRHARSYRDLDGAGNVHLRDNPEVTAELMSYVIAERDERFAAARREGAREPLEAYAADALVALVRRGAGSPAPTLAVR